MSDISTKIRPRLAGSLAGDVGSLSSDEWAARALLDFPGESIVKAAADSMATDATALTKVWSNPFPFPIWLQDVIITPGATLTANDTNNASVLLLTDNGADGTPAAAATWLTATTASSGTGNWATDIAVRPSSYTAAQRTLVAGACLFWQITKASAGVVVPAMRIIPVFRKV